MVKNNREVYINREKAGNFSIKNRQRKYGRLQGESNMGVIRREYYGK